MPQSDYPILGGDSLRKEIYNHQALSKYACTWGENKN